MKNQKVSKMQKASYAIGSGAGNVIITLMSTFLTAYYTDTVGMAIAAIGTMMLYVRFLDGISDIIMGAIIEKTNTKWGKARPWMLYSVPLIIASVVLTLNVPERLGDSGKLVYIYLTYILLNCITYTAFQTAHSALLARITLDPNERQSMTSINQIANTVVTLVLNAVTAGMVAAVGWKYVAWFYAILTAAGSLICFFGTQEIVDSAENDRTHTAEKVPFKVSLSAAMKNKYFYMLIIAAMLVVGATAANGTTLFYFCNNVLGDVKYLTPVTFALSVSAIGINFFVPAIVRKIGSHKALIASAIVYTLGFVIIGIGGSNLILIMIGQVIRGAGQGAFYANIFATIAQVVDYGDWKFNVRTEGLISISYGFGAKLGMGFGAAIASWILASGGYDGLAAVQSASALSAIKFSFGWLNAIIGVLMIILSIFLNVGKYSDEMQEALSARMISE